MQLEASPKRDYYQLWRALCQKRPDVARDIASTISTRRFHSDTEIRTFINQIEERFNLPLGSIATKREVISGHVMAELKKAALCHFTRHSKTQYGRLAMFFGYSHHSGVSRSVQVAEQHIQAGDETFSKYYNIIKTIEV